MTPNIRHARNACTPWIVLIGLAFGVPAQADDDKGYTTPVEPHRIHGNTWYVGSKGVSALLVTSPQGHVLIDAPMESNAALIESNVRQLGFRVQDIRVILNSHAHPDHAGAIAQLARDSGAVVRTTAAAASALKAGGNDPEDPQNGFGGRFPSVAAVGDVKEGTVVRVGPLRLTAHETPGHTPGGTSWTWRSCETPGAQSAGPGQGRATGNASTIAKPKSDRAHGGGACLDIAFVDSLTPYAAEGYRFSDRPAYVQAYRHSFERVEALPCDRLLTPHPEQSEGKDCKAYAQTMRQKLDDRLKEEAAAQAAR